MKNNAHLIDMNHLLLAFPAKIQTGALSEIERQLLWGIWGWVLEQFIDAKYRGGKHGK